MSLGTLHGHKPPALENPGGDSLKTRPQIHHLTYTAPGQPPGPRTPPGSSGGPWRVVVERNAGPEKNRVDINGLRGWVQPFLGQQLPLPHQLTHLSFRFSETATTERAP